jgi:hypothetical protein
MEYTAEQLRAALENARAAGDTNAESKILARLGAMPQERLRAAAQGLTLGFADEIAAAARAPFGAGSLEENYGAALGNERARLENYREGYPMSALGYEVGGAVLPAFASMGLSAPLAAATVAATGARGVNILGAGLRGASGGAKAGAAYGFGTGEGGFTNRAANAGVEALIGGGVGAGLGAAGKAINEFGGRTFLNWVRNKMGDRMAGVVSAEVQRLAENGGLTADEVIEGVAKGTIMAENRTLQSAIRKFYSEGGPAGAEIGEVLGARPAQTRAAAMGELQGAMTESGNPLANRRASEELTRRAEDEAYERAFRQGGVEIPAPIDVVQSMADIAVRAPSALKAAAEVARVQHGVRPFFTEAENGAIVFTREPTLREAELTYRSLRDMASRAFAEKSGTLGGALDDISKEFKGGLDEASAALKVARAEAKVVRDARDAFNQGQKAATLSPDELQLVMSDIEAAGPEAVQGFRDGLTAAIRKAMSRPPSIPSTLRNLANEETGLGTALRLSLPEAEAPQVLQRLEVADRSQAASNAILGGSQTAQTALAPSVGGTLNTAQEVVSGMGGDLMAWARLLTGLAGDAQPKLTDAQRLEVARIVLSEDPVLVERALRDSSLVGRLQSATERAIDKVTAASVRSSPVLTTEGRERLKENRR